MLIAQVVMTEFKRIARKRSVHVLAVLYVLLMALAVTTASLRFQQVEHERADAVAESDRQWNEQPERHPHRVVHFGDYAIKSLSPLSRFDWGVESYTGTTIFLEGHRQNSANFNEASQSTSLLRFGQLSPAFILQVLLPLCIVFLGFSLVSGDRESGLLKQLLASGLNTWVYVFGKCLILILVGLLALLPLFALGVYVVIGNSDMIEPVLYLCLGYVAYVTVWSCLTIIVSVWLRTAYACLLSLVGLWMLFSLGMPRILSSMAEQRFPAPSYVESEMRAEKAMKSVGDSHNPDDPYFNNFKQKTLKKYNVSRVEDLPLNYNGLLMLEGERLTSEIYQQERDKLFSIHQTQNRWVDRFIWLNPLMAVSKASQILSGTAYADHEQFLRDSEQQRYSMIQELNELHTHSIKHENDRMQTLSADSWKAISRQRSSSTVFGFSQSGVDRPIFALLLWLAVAWFLLSISAMRLESMSND
jgi:ABC-2 type transport system permease protein